MQAFVRSGSEARVPAGVDVIAGDPFSLDQLSQALTPDTTLVHLIGTPRPNPSRAREFRAVDLASVRVAASAAARARIAHLVYVSVAQPAPVMQAYVAARAEGEALVRASGVPATILRPWYVLGPGHWWPYALLPLYWMYEHVPSKRDAARRLALVTRGQMIAALIEAIESGAPKAVRILEVPEIRNAALQAL